MRIGGGNFALLITRDSISSSMRNLSFFPRMQPSFPWVRGRFPVFQQVVFRASPHLVHAGEKIAQHCVETNFHLGLRSHRRWMARATTRSG
eukprot:COSAG01_NODE_6654_length_3561_cov_24.557192_3_plen_91_part_00